MVRWTMIASAALALVSCWRQDALPPAQSLRPELLEEPAQAPVHAAARDASVNGYQYRIEPRFEYELHGLVVSLHDADTWWDYAHREWGDHVNVLDLCVVWGNNVRREAYREASWSNDQWTCWWSTTSEAAYRAFDKAAFSNNHLVTDDPAVARALRKARIGDQVRIRGYLADYATLKDGVARGLRVSSTVRTDTGNGACETIYVEDFQILASAGRPWRALLKAALLALLASLLLWAFLPPPPVRP